MQRHGAEDREGGADQVEGRSSGHTDGGGNPDARRRREPANGGSGSPEGISKLPVTTSEGLLLGVVCREALDLALAEPGIADVVATDASRA